MKKILLSVFFAAAVLPGSAFEWPQLIADYSSIVTYFAQETEGCFSSSIVFSGRQQAAAAEKGSVLITFSEKSPGIQWPYFTVGNAVILSHDDEMITMYSNLEKITILHQSSSDEIVLAAGSEIGSAGGSGWHTEKSTFSFYAADIKNKCVINPIILLPVLENPPPHTVTAVYVTAKNGLMIDLSQKKTLSQGEYVLYADSGSVMPISVQISHNGAAVETLSYDMLKQTEIYLCAAGKKMYPGKTIYKYASKIMLAEVLFTRGNNSISVSSADVSGAVRTVSYNINVL